VGGKAQAKAMRRVAGKLRLDLAQYRELVTFLQFGSDLDKATQDQITRGERVVEILKQGQYVPLDLSQQVLIISAAVNGYLDDLPVNQLKKFEIEFLQHMGEKYPQVAKEIDETGDLTAVNTDLLKKVVEEFKAAFKKK